METLDENTEPKEQYKSQDGFVTRTIVRGLTEIGPIWPLIEDNNGMILGGYARYCVSPKKKPVDPGDVDIYVRSDEAFEAMKKGLVDLGFEVRHENAVALTFESPEEGPVSTVPPPQLIKPENKGAIVATGTNEEILASFDFTIVRVGITNTTDALADADFEHDEKYGLLRIKNIHCPVSSLLRCMKYARKGYFLRPAEAMKLFMDWDNRDDEYRARLVELFTKGEGPGQMTREEIDELECLLRID